MSELETTFNKLVSDYSERLYWHIRAIVEDHDEADDILQNVFMKAWQALPSFRGECSHFTWLWRIATNESLLALRKIRFKGLFVGLENAFGVSDSDFNGNKAETELQKAIMTLPPKQKSVFCMRYYEELSYEEISEITDTSVGALKASYHFAYEKVKKYLTD